MLQFSRFQFTLVFLALLLLRIVVGFHFFKEGTNKLKSGTFTSKYFFAASKGPIAPFFNSLIDDSEGRTKLCIETAMGSDGRPVAAINPESTYQLWDDYIDRATSYYGFGSPDLIEDLSARQAEIDKRLLTPGSQDEKTGEPENLRQELESVADAIEQIQSQPSRANEIFESHKLLLADFLDANESALLAHFNSADRLDGFAKDGENRQDVALYVDSLRGQVDKIRVEQNKELAGWTAEVNAIWNSLEEQINSLATGVQAEKSRLLLHRPFDRPNSALKIIDHAIPWFDTIIGVLLILGLFSRLASLAAGLFLLSVIATQPPWIPGTEPTYFYFIEMAACFVIFATAAGRFGGLDYFLTRRKPAEVTASA